MSDDWEVLKEELSKYMSAYDKTLIASFVVARKMYYYSWSCLKYIIKKIFFSPFSN